MSYLNNGLIKSVGKILGEIENVDEDDRETLLTIIENLPLAVGFDPEAEIEPTTQMDAAVNALLFKYSNRLDDVRSLVKEEEGRIGQEVIEERDKQGRSTPEHVINTRLKFNPTYVKEKGKSDQFRRLTEFLEALKWQVVRRKEIVQTVLTKQY